MGNFDGFSREPNSYFDHGSATYNNEKNLISVIINEYYNKYGVCMEYYVVDCDMKCDNIWGEDNNRSFDRNFSVNGYFNLPREDKIWTQFGIEGMDEITLWISKRHFQGASIDKSNGQSYVRPRVGDVIKSEYSNYFYEITEVAEDTGQYFQSNQHVWELTIRPMKDEFISVSSELSASDIAKVINLDDIFNIDDQIDIEKEDTLYEPETIEKPNNDPFGNW